MRHLLLTFAALSSLLLGCGFTRPATMSAGYAAPAPATVSGSGYGADEGYVMPAAPSAPFAQSVALASDTTMSVEAASDVASPPVPQPTSPVAVSGPAASEMLDIEAHLTIEVETLHDGILRFKQLVRAHGGALVGESVVDNAGSSGATFTLRLPSHGADEFFSALSEVGRIRQRQVAVRDVGKEYFDATLQLHNFEAALTRYEELLAKAQTVAEMLQIQNELTRLKGEIDRVKGAMRFLHDRVARATVYVSLITHQADIEAPFNPDAKLYPGLRAGFLSDFRGSAGTTSFGDAGISIRATRAFSIDLDLGRRLGGDTSSSGVDMLLLTLGGEFYSDFLGAGKRRYLNPYIGFRAGYARILGVNELAVGGTLGLELVHTKAVSLALDGRVYGIFGGSTSAQAVIQPALAFNVAF